MEFKFLSYYLQEYITLQKLFQLPPAIIYKNI